MGFLFICLAIAGLSAFLHSLRWAQGRDVYIYLMAPVNYLTAAAVFGAWCAGAGVSFRAESMLYGCAVGLCYGTSFFLLLYGMRAAGVARTTTIVNLAYIIPVLASIAIWGEKLWLAGAAGIVLGLVSIPLVLWPDKGEEIRRDRRKRVTAWAALAGLYFAQGLAYAIMKGFERLGRPDEKPVMLLGLFGTAAAFTAGVYLFKFRRPAAKDIFHGVFTGLCNAFTNGMLVTALTISAASVVFPSFTVGTIMAVTLTSVFIWHERHSVRAWIGLALACVSIALMNL